MAPSFVSEDIFNKIKRKIEAFGNFLFPKLIRLIESFDLSYLFLYQDMVRILFSKELMRKSVLSFGHHFQIVKGIILFVAIKMMYIKSWGDWLFKETIDQPMEKIGSSTMS